MSSVEETLAWEAEQRPRAAYAAIIAGVFSIVGSLLLILTTNGGPNEDDGFISVTESLSKRLSNEPLEERSLLVRQADFLDDKLPQLFLATALTTLAVVGACLALTYLYRATKARSPETTGRAPIIAVGIALGAYVVGHLVRDLATWTGVAGVDADARADDLREVSNGGGALAGALVEQIGTFALGLAFVLVSLNAMRVGLLTRFFGILGVIVGGLAVIQLDQPQIVRAFWLVGLGALLLSATRRPPAWETGRAMPWPSNQQLREARQQADLGTNVPPTEPDSPAEKGATGQPAVKRKRKKRR